MNFDLTETQSEIVQLAARFAEKEISPFIEEDEATGHFRKELFPKAGAAGLLGITAKEEDGGLGLGTTEYALMLEQLATVSSGYATSISVTGLPTSIISAGGNAEQKAKYLPPLLSGEQIGAFCLTEPSSGSDAGSLRTTAVKQGDHYVINGSKSWITHGGVADSYTLFARTGDAKGDISCFLVPGDAEGLTADSPEHKMGMTGSPTATMLFDNVRVSADRRLGAEGDGLKIALAGLDSGRLGIAAVATGLAQGALDQALAYAKERETFGKRIIDHQGLAFVLADMEAAVQTARAMTLHAARLKDAGLPFSREASIAKLVATDNAMKVTTDAVQVLGGYGYTRDFPVERFMREAKVMQIFEGTNQIQRMVISRALDKDNHGTIVSVEG